MTPPTMTTTTSVAITGAQREALDAAGFHQPSACIDGDVGQLQDALTRIDGALQTADRAVEDAPHYLSRRDAQLHRRHLRAVRITLFEAIEQLLLRITYRLDAVAFGEARANARHSGVSLDVWLADNATAFGVDGEPVDAGEVELEPIPRGAEGRRRSASCDLCCKRAGRSTGGGFAYTRTVITACGDVCGAVAVYCFECHDELKSTGEAGRCVDHLAYATELDDVEEVGADGEPVDAGDGLSDFADNVRRQFAERGLGANLMTVSRAERDALVLACSLARRRGHSMLSDWVEKWIPDHYADDLDFEAPVMQMVGEDPYPERLASVNSADESLLVMTPDEWKSTRTMLARWIDAELERTHRWSDSECVVVDQCIRIVERIDDRLRFDREPVDAGCPDTAVVEVTHNQCVAIYALVNGARHDADRAAIADVARRALQPGRWCRLEGDAEELRALLALVVEARNRTGMFEPDRADKTMLTQVRKKLETAVDRIDPLVGSTEEQVVVRPEMLIEVPEPIGDPGGLHEAVDVAAAGCRAVDDALTEALDEIREARYAGDIDAAEANNRCLLAHQRHARSANIAWRTLRTALDALADGGDLDCGIDDEDACIDASAPRRTETVDRRFGVEAVVATTVDRGRTSTYVHVEGCANSDADHTHPLTGGRFAGFMTTLDGYLSGRGRCSDCVAGRPPWSNAPYMRPRRPYRRRRGARNRYRREHRDGRQGNRRHRRSRRPHPVRLGRGGVSGERAERRS